MSNEYKLVPFEPTDEMIHVGCDSYFDCESRAWSAMAGAYKAMLAAAPQPPALGGDLGSTMMRIAADLVCEKPLRNLYGLCESQSRVSSAKLHGLLECAGDVMKQTGIDIRRAIEKDRAHLAPLQAEIERLKDNVREVTTYRDNAVKKIERLRNELTGTEKERDQLKARCDELEGFLKSAKYVVEAARTIEKIAFREGTQNVNPASFRGLGILLEQYDAALSKPAGSEQV